MKRILAMIICILTVVSIVSCSTGNKSDLLSFIPEAGFPVCETSYEFIDNMTYGWNLGLAMSYYNANEPLLDSRPDITSEDVVSAQVAWGNPVTTQEMINEVRDKGFNLIRVQVSYYNHMDAEGNIDKLWLDRVVEVVDYCMNADVYCLLTATGLCWATAEPKTFEEQSAIYRRIWEQVAARFVDYDDRLLFESFNELLPEGGWGSSVKDKHIDTLEKFCQVFVDTVRASGGYNETRNLVINPIAATYSYDLNKKFDMPKDPADNHLIASVHCYHPQQFCFNETNLGSTDFRNEWGGATDEEELDSLLRDVRKRFIEELEVPVIVGEFGVVDRATEEERAEYISFYSKTAKKYGIKLVLFDDGWDFTVFEREDLSWPYEKVIEALFSAEEVNE